MENVLILCGGTGAHAGLAFLRLHTLGYALGFFRPESAKDDKGLNFPRIYLVDQDSGDGEESSPTAWQLVRELVRHHPGRYQWQELVGNPDGPDLVKVTPLPLGPNQQWFKPPNNSLAQRFESSRLLPALTSQRQRRIDYSKGMMGSPAIGSMLFKLKEFDERNLGLNHDETFGQLLQRQGRMVVVGSGVGGTGASVGPTLATRLAGLPGNQVMAVMILNWFAFEENQADDEKREKAQLRNRIMRENAASALDFYGQSLSQKVAAVPIGMPERAYVTRQFTSDLGQPVRESFIHAVAALCGYCHYLGQSALGPGLYAMGAVERGRLDGSTVIPGGTLQGLANQAATLADTLETWQQVLARPQRGRVTPAIWDLVASVADPVVVAEHLAHEIEHYREQLDWMKEALAIEGQVDRELSLEMGIRQHLEDPARWPELTEKTPVEEIPSALFHWTARWIAEITSIQNGLEVAPGGVSGAQWPDLRREGIRVAATENGDLTRIPDEDISPVLEAFVDPKHVAANGWPHPLAAADYFRHVVERRDPTAIRQLELLWAGLMADRIELRPLHITDTAEPEITLEFLTGEFRRQGYSSLAEYGLYLKQGGALVGFTAPHTLFCPVPFMNDKEDNRFWQELWSSLSGANDGMAWAEAPMPRTWGENDRVVRQIRSWIEQQRRFHQGSAPPWTRVFEESGIPVTPVPFGVGLPVQVFWGSPTDVKRPLLRISLPTADATGRWVPPPGTPELAENELLSRVPELRELKDQEGRVLFSQVVFEKPGREGEVRGFWEDHLNQLQQLGHIFIWSRTAGGNLIVGTLVSGALHQTAFRDSQVLDRSTVTVVTCTPFVQEPVPGSPTPVGDVRYPDLPLKADYLDLIDTSEGKSLLDRLKGEEDIRPFLRRPSLSRDAQGHLVIRWSVPLRGRSLSMPVEIRLEGEPFHKAHWMVWPRFRTPRGGWKAYYVYEHCTDRRLLCDVLWLQFGAPSGPGVRLLPRPNERKKDAGPYPVGYSSRGGRHVGGPPLALSVRNIATGEEGGLYMIPLQTFPEVKANVSLAVDFGTSHTVAAFQLSGGQSRSLELTSDLDPAYWARSLTLHLSEARSHVEAEEVDGGLLAAGAWLPTYRKKKSEGLLPSELLLILLLEKAQAKSVSEWVPLQDFTIPPMDISRSDVGEVLIADFKWDTGSSSFQGQEKALREHYLTLTLEMFLAEIVAHQLKGLPVYPVNLTFTYPLRSTEMQVQALRDSLAHVIERCGTSLGLTLVLQDGSGLYDESRAARLSTANLGEVCLVGDLGGGTLDLFVAANNGSGKTLKEVADSVRIGGNLLLHQIAENPQGYLPNDGGWVKGEPGYTEARLRAWMRSEGCHKLFGLEAGGRPPLQPLGVLGFNKAADAARTRQLIDRYFRLVAEYMARHLVSFLVGQWFPLVSPDHYERLRISVQLRGNGWRLRYQKESYEQTTQAIQDLVRQRLSDLWAQVTDNSYPAPIDDRFWESPSRYWVPDPKMAPIKSVVGKAMPYDDVIGNWYTHTLVDLEVQRNGGFKHVPWHSQIPFDTGKSTQVQIKGITPPLLLSSSVSDERVEIRGLEASLEGRVNSSLQTEGVVDEGDAKFRAPVGPLVWEAVFDSRDFWPGRGTR